MIHIYKLRFSFVAHAICGSWKVGKLEYIAASETYSIVP